MTLAPTGVNLLKPAPDPTLVRPPGNRAPTPTPVPGQPLDGNVAPPGSPLPVGNGIPPVTPTPVPNFVPTGVNTGTFGPGNDLRSSVITAPTADRAGGIAKLQPGYTDLLKTPALEAGPAVTPATPDLANRVGALSKDYSSALATPELQAGAAVNPNEDPRLAAARATTDASAGAVGGVDRRKAATDLLADFDRSTADSQREDYRTVGQQAASLGRLGMGQTAQDIQEVGRKHLTDRATLATNLAAQTTAQEAQDRLDKANLSRGVEGDIYGQGAASRGELRTERGNVQDIAAQNRSTALDVKKTGLNLATDVGSRSLQDEAAARGELRTERGNVQDIAAQNRSAEAAAKLTGLGTAQDVTGQSIRDEQDQAAALRGERGYQFGAAETATDRAVQQAQLEEAIRSGQFELGTTLAQLGYSGSPAGAQLGQANIDQAAAGDDIGGIAELLKRYGYTSATKAA